MEDTNKPIGYDNLMRFLVQTERMEIAKPGVYTKLLKNMVDLYQEGIEDCETRMAYLRNEYEILQAQNYQLQQQISWYKQRYDKPVTFEKLDPLSPKRK